MRIKYIDRDTSFVNILGASLILGLSLITHISMYATDIENADRGFVDFFYQSWVSIKAELTGDYIHANYFICVISSFLAFCFLVALIISRHNALKYVNGANHLKSVDFLPARIDFNYHDRNNDFTCFYDEVLELELNLHTSRGTREVGHEPVIDEIELGFIFQNGEIYLKNVPIFVQSRIYSILDYSRKIKKFKLTFNGYGEPEGLREKFLEYREKGCKLLSSFEEFILLFSSVIFFIIGCYVYLFFGNTMWYNSGAIWATVVAIVLSVVCDALMVWDFRKRRNFYPELPPANRRLLIIVLKIIAIIAVLLSING